MTSTTPGSTCPSGSANPACTAVTTVLIPGLTITTTAGSATTTPGSVVSYTITVTDTGQTSYTGATVTDDLTNVLNDSVYNGDATATSGAVTYASPVLTWTGNLAPGDTRHDHVLDHHRTTPTPATSTWSPRPSRPTRAAPARPAVPTRPAPPS